MKDKNESVNSYGEALRNSSLRNNVQSDQSNGVKREHNKIYRYKDNIEPDESYTERMKDVYSSDLAFG